MTATEAKPTFQIPADHVVLASYAEGHRVSSDHAWLDSGSGYRVEMWDRAAQKPASEYVNTGWGDGPYPVMPAPDATDADRDAYRAYLRAEGFVRDAQGAAEAAHYLKQGAAVEVVRGRKAPRGRYEVAAHGSGNYGPYVHLRAADGTRYNYISVENVRIVPDYDAALGNRKFSHDSAATFLAAVARAGWTATAWGIFADWAEEVGLDCDPVATADFAAALRRITSGPDAPKFSTYHADCHNEFRRPFAGI